MKKKIIIIIIVLILGIITFFIIKHFSKKNSNIIKTYGNIEIRQVDLSFRVSGILKEVYVEEGDYVKKGDLLAELDNKDYLANYNKSIYQAESNFAQFKDDNSIFKRRYPLCLDGTLSKEECETLLNKKDLSNAKYKESKANKEYQKLQLNYTKMYAPQDGIITTRAQEKGAHITQNQIVYVMSLNKPIWVRSYIQETDIGKIKYGTKAKIITDTIDKNTNKEKEYSGHIGYISPVAEFTPKTVQTEDLRVDLVYRVRIYIDNIDDFLRQGMPVTIKIDTNEEENAKMHWN